MIRLAFIVYIKSMFIDYPFNLIYLHLLCPFTHLSLTFFLQIYEIFFF